MRESIKFKRRADGFLVFVAVMCAMALVFIIVMRDYDAKLAEQEHLKSEIVIDNDWLTKRNTDLEKQIQLLEEKVSSQQATIDRLMKLETVQEVESRGMSEGRGEPLIGQAAIIQTALDRATAWGITVQEAISAPGQYAPPFQGKTSKDMKTAFELVFLDGFRVFPENTTHFATYPAYWSRGKALRAKIGTHYYYGPEE